MAEPAFSETDLALRRLYALDEYDLPFEDDEPMAENDYQLDAMVHSFRAFKARMFIHYPHVDGRGRVTRRSVASDVFVVLGVAKRRRYSYVMWQEGKVPDLALEVLSPSSWRRDLEEKVGVYASLGVGEYFQFDPTGEWMEPRLRGLVLRDGVSERLGEVELSNGRRGVYSEALIQAGALMLGRSSFLCWLGRNEEAGEMGSVAGCRDG